MRKFSKSQKQILYTNSKGVCTLCKKQLTKSWHADHIIPYSKGGDTAISNGQALCPKCNLKKSNKMKKLELREWQKDYVPMPHAFYKEDKASNFLAHVGVGAGKTLATVKASELFNGFEIIVISPSDNVKKNWEKTFREIRGLKIDYSYSFQYDYKSNFDGITITYHSLNSINLRWMIKNNIVNENTLIICDEIHHCGMNKSWGDAVNTLCSYAGFSIFLTGTPFRHDNEKIPFCTYNKIGEIKTDYSYTYAELVNDMVCCPIIFKTENVIYNNKVFNPLDDNKILNAAILINGNGNMFIKNVIDKANSKLCKIRDSYKPNAAGLVVCNTIDDAKALQPYLQDSVVVTSDDKNGSAKIEAFRKSESNFRWIIAVNMVAEGVDIPRLRVLIYLTNTTTRMFFEQADGRVVRNRMDPYSGTLDLAYVYIPNYVPLTNHAHDIENAYLHIIEEQEKKSRASSEYSERELKTLDGDIDSVIGDDITGGESVHKFEKSELAPIALQNNIPLDTLIRIYAGFKKDNTIKKEAEIDMRTKLDTLSGLINKMVGAIYFRTGMDYGAIHAKLNSEANMLNTKSATLEQLKLKLKLAQQWEK